MCTVDVLTPFLPTGGKLALTLWKKVFLERFVLNPSVSVYKDTPPVLIGAKTDIPCPSTQFNPTGKFLLEI